MTAPAKRKQPSRQERAALLTRHREARWEADRYSVPYRVDGPTISLSVLWFLALTGGLIFFFPVAVLAATIAAAIAGLQTGHAWARIIPTDRRGSAAMAAAITFAGAFGRLPLGLAMILGAIAAALLAAFAEPASGKAGNIDIATLAETAVRSALPAGLAAGSILALSRLDLVAAVALVALVSAYEAGDYLVGTGSANAYEGPIAGLVTLGVIGVGFWLLQPAPFDATSAILFAALAAVCCPIGQVFGSAILPRGNAWAPGLRRLDSYLVAAPLWLLLFDLIQPPAV